ncbi:MAG: 23S rRNA (adenine(2503)-C(2))-methyltransferase RlmN [Acetanaerobacterium sp.]
MTDKTDIKSLAIEELREQLSTMGEPAFRAGQIFSWLHQKHAGAFSEMTSLSKALRDRLEERFYIPRVAVKHKLVSAIDGTVKYLYELEDGETVEAVFMRYHHGNSLCISTQVGCRMGCTFCASTLGGFVRNLTAAEMLGEIETAEGETGEKVSSLVLMGIGEPLDNYDNVVRFLQLLSSKEGMNMSLRHVSLSTCGLVPRINDLAQLRLGLTLSVSLHAPNDQIRSRTMPVNRRYSIDALLAACRHYAQTTSRRISFEYALIDGVNDSEQNARELARRLRGMLCHVNLIAVNPVRECGVKASPRTAVERFTLVLERERIPVTVRRRLGADINAACGQLRRERREGGRRLTED